MIVQWVITAHLGLGQNTSTRVQLDLSTPTLGWENPRTVCHALQVTHYLLLINMGFPEVKWLTGGLG